MKEIYRSFEGKLNVENQSGYIIYEIENFYQIEFISVRTSGSDKVRIKKELLQKEDFENLEKITEIEMDIENGRADYGQCWYKEKWYSYDTINKIQCKNQDNYWKRYVK